MRIEILTPPAVEPVTVAEAKTYCRVDADITSEDVLIGSLITAAREQLETRTSRAYAEQTVRVTLDNFPYKGIIVLPRAPLRQVQSIKFDDENGNEQELPLTQVRINNHTVPGAIQVVHSWPITSYNKGAVRIEFTCGYSVDGTGTEQIPKKAKTAMLWLTNHYFQHRETVVKGMVATSLPMGVETLIESLKIHYRVAQ